MWIEKKSSGTGSIFIFFSSTATHSSRWNPSPTRCGSSSAISWSWPFTIVPSCLRHWSSYPTYTSSWGGCAAVADGGRTETMKSESVDYVRLRSLSPSVHSDVTIWSLMRRIVSVPQNWYSVQKSLSLCTSLRSSVWRNTSERRMTRSSRPTTRGSESHQRGLLLWSSCVCRV